MPSLDRVVPTFLPSVFRRRRQFRRPRTSHKRPLPQHTTAALTHVLLRTGFLTFTFSIHTWGISEFRLLNSYPSALVFLDIFYQVHAGLAIIPSSTVCFRANAAPITMLRHALLQVRTSVSLTPHERHIYWSVSMMR